jgi:O-antigen ligase
LATGRGEAYGLWHVTHNTYTQISSEMGLLGLFIYVAFLVQCWRVLTAVIRKKGVSADLRFMAHTLRATLLVIVTVATFASLAYNVDIPILGGLITALSFVTRDQLARDREKKKQQQVAPLPAPEPVLEPSWSGQLY